MKHETYKRIYEKQAAFYFKRAWARKALQAVNHAATLTIATGFFALLIYLSIKREWLNALFTATVCLAAYFAVTLLRYVFKRSRPYDEKGAGITPLFKKKDGTGKSFPSRHLTSAFVIGTVFLPYATWAAILIYALGSLLGYARYAAGLHYPTDLLAGALLGVFFGLLIFVL